MLPEGVKSVRMRCDSAGYQEALLRYCEMGGNERFGRIEFAVASDVTQEFKKVVAEVAEDDWHTIYRVNRHGERHATSQQWAEVCFVPNTLARSTKGEYRFLAVREPLAHQPLPGMGEQLCLPFPAMEFGRTYYKLSGIVTNLTWDGEAVVRWLRERCGKSEEVHSIAKSDFAGGQLPSAQFGVNAAWWAIMILALNLNEAMKRLVLATASPRTTSWAVSRMKALRFRLINLPGLVMYRARQLVVRIAGTLEDVSLLLAIRQRIAALAATSPG